MRYRPVTFASASERHASEPQSSTARLINMFAEAGTADRPLILRSCPGLTRVVDGAGAPVRAMLATDEAIYYAAGSTLYSFDGTTATTLGYVPDDAQTTLAWNGEQVAVVAGGRYWLWTGESMKQIPGTAFSDFGSVAFMSGYFLFTEKGGQRVQISHLYDGETIGALDFASAEYAPDSVVRGFVDHSEWWLFGSRSIEVWTNTGAADFPFQRIDGAQMEAGCRQVNTVAKLDNTVFWVGNDGIVWRAVQYRPERVSDHRVEAAIGAASKMSAFVYNYEGHKFYVLRLDGRPAWVYDVATQLWHERSSGTDHGPWMGTAAAQLGDDWYVGTGDGHICRLERVWREDGGVLAREAQSGLLALGGGRFRLPGAIVDCGSDAGGTLMMQHSEDAATWSRELRASIGALGEYGKRDVEFRRLGMGRRFAMRLRFTDDADLSIYAAGVRVA